MPLLNNLKSGFDQSIANIKSPFERYFRSPLNMKGALERNDFQGGLEIVEFSAGVKLENEKILLVGNSMPQVPFTYGGQQKLVKDYYPGNSEPTVQVLGPRENNITIKGRLYAKRFKDTQSRFAASNTDETGQSLRNYPSEMAELIEAMRIRGNLVRITMGEFQRFGFIEEAKFDMKTLADIDYEITFSIIGFNPPKDAKVLGRARTVPIEINKNLIAGATTLQQTASIVPDSVPLDLADQLNEAISDVAGAVNLVTGFVDNVLTEVDSVKNSIARAQGLIKNAKNNITRLQRRVGSFATFGGVSQTNGIYGSYKNASYFQSNLSQAFSISALLASLSIALKKLAETEPFGRHRVAASDTLQAISMKFYKDASHWKEIYDHNKLTSTELEVGTILEIPRVT